jgi:hypothetical protein
MLSDFRPMAGGNTATWRYMRKTEISVFCLNGGGGNKGVGNHGVHGGDGTTGGIEYGDGHDSRDRNEQTKFDGMGSWRGGDSAGHIAHRFSLSVIMNKRITEG